MIVPGRPQVLVVTLTGFREPFSVVDTWPPLGLISFSPEPSFTLCSPRLDVA